METTKRIVCLANSRKHSGWCVAGRELIRERPRAWVRPVSNRPKEEVSAYERQYADGSDPQLLDIIDIPLLQASPRDHQKENWLLDSKARWSKVGQYPRSDLNLLANTGGTLWSNGYSTRNGQNDQIPIGIAATETGSLKLICIDSLQINVYCYYNKRHVQAQFQFYGTDYALKVTDPMIEEKYLARQDGEYRLGKCYLTISLGEAFNGYCYKLVAAVIRAGN